ncbi:hypothetical protein N7467_006200 [Penicillium canescens]|nr:hypothetical protein N7467_006200 [Penicillium canescens]
MLQSQLFAPVSIFLPLLRGVSVSQHGQSASSRIPQQAMSSFKPAVRHLCPETSAAQAYDAGGNIKWSTCVKNPMYPDKQWLMGDQLHYQLKIAMAVNWY